MRRDSSHRKEVFRPCAWMAVPREARSGEFLCAEVISMRSLRGSSALALAALALAGLVAGCGESSHGSGGPASKPAATAPAVASASAPAASSPVRVTPAPAWPTTAATKLHASITFGTFDRSQ